jgi:hypothetical protein
MNSNDIKNKEDKHERFKRLATQRTLIVIDRLRVLGNCSNRYVYEYTEEDVKKIFSAIDSALSEIKKKFYVPRENEFKLE